MIFLLFYDTIKKLEYNQAMANTENLIITNALFIFEYIFSFVHRGLLWPSMISALALKNGDKADFSMTFIFLG